MTGYTVDPAGLQSAAPAYDAQSSALADIYSTLVGSLNAEGDCWGNDDAGRAFAANYVGPAVTALNQMAAACDGLASTADGVYQWAQNYLKADQAAQQDLTAQLGS